MASYLSSYLSRPRGTSLMRPSAAAPPVIRQYTPYSTNQSRGTSSTPISAPYAGQNLAALLLQTQQNRTASNPSSVFNDTYNYDPIQAKIAALGTQSVANSRTNAAQLRNSAAINEGDPELLKSLGFDQNTIDAAAGNPQSLLAQLNTDYANRQQQLKESMDNQNLYYSGEYQKQLAQMAKGYATGQGDLGQKLRELLSGADQGVLDSTELDRQNQLQAQLQAQQQAQWNDLLSQLSGATAPPPPPPPVDPGTGAVAPAGFHPIDPSPGTQFDPLFTPQTLPAITSTSPGSNFVWDPVSGRYINKAPTLF